MVRRPRFTDGGSQAAEGLMVRRGVSKRMFVESGASSLRPQALGNDNAVDVQEARVPTGEPLVIDAVVVRTLPEGEQEGNNVPFGLNDSMNGGLLVQVNKALTG